MRRHEGWRASGRATLPLEEKYKGFLPAGSQKNCPLDLIGSGNHTRWGGGDGAFGIRRNSARGAQKGPTSATPARMWRGQTKLPLIFIKNVTIAQPFINTQKTYFNTYTATFVLTRWIKIRHTWYSCKFFTKLERGWCVLVVPGCSKFQTRRNLKKKKTLESLVRSITRRKLQLPGGGATSPGGKRETY